jgi:hypothetical protein
MRRCLSIFLILIFWLGPLAVALPGIDESRIPACCRRHGAHHCANSLGMSATLAESAPSQPVFTAPLTCPFFPGYSVARTSQAQALAPPPVSLPVLLAQAHSPVAGRAAARLSQVRTRAGRGPPASTHA